VPVTGRHYALSMSLLKLTRGHALLASPLWNVAKRALYFAILLLPGSLIVLPVL